MANECKHIKVAFLTLLCIGIYVYLYDLTCRNFYISKSILEDVKQSLNMQVLIIKSEERTANFLDESSFHGKTNRALQSETKIKLNNEKIVNKSENLKRAQERTSRKIDNLKQEVITKEYQEKNKYEFPVITLFTSWSVDIEKYLCRNTTVHNWSRLKPTITPILFTNDTDLTKRVQKKGWKVHPVVKTGIGIPVLKDMFLAAMNFSKSAFYGYANGDILFTEGLLKTVLAVENMIDVYNNTILMIGQRTNVQNISMQDAGDFELLRNISKQRGELFTAWGEDYFITSANYPWKDMPDVVIGRRAFDNFIVIESLKRGFIVIDATKTVLAVHHTTKSGNFENRKKENNDYNVKIISKYYKNGTINYAKGLTKCANYYTNILSNNTITLLKKKKPYC
ncbi:uncharacterized protein LOC134247109 [Saccostrea cucullata]|uniref:uncharacterized protein LOC134247109 n=1 Tax=Saccostrea cuccullata TaxID=36930 RepID=UPI002ED4F098